MRTASADKKEVPLKAAPLPAKRPGKASEMVSVTELKGRVALPAGRPVLKAPAMTKSASFLPKVKRPITAPSKRPPSPTQGKDVRLGPNRTTGKLPVPQPWQA